MTKSNVKTKQPKQRRTQAQRSDATRLLILQACAKILRRRGINGLRTQTVAAKAGVSQGAQFHHFPNKKDLVIATIKYVNDVALETSKARAKKLETKDDVFESLIEDANEFYFSDYFFMTLAVGFSGEDDDEIQLAVRQLIWDTRSAVEKIWRERLTRVELPEQIASDLLSLTLSIVRGFSIRSLIGEDRTEIDRLLNVWRDMLRAYLKEQNLPMT